MYKFSIGSWVRLLLFSFLLVALAGTLMRYKMAFPLPWMPQKNMQYAHSHLAFISWMSQSLFVLLLHRLQHWLAPQQVHRLQAWLLLHWALGLLMFVVFLIYGYRLPAIVLSSLAFICQIRLVVLLWPEVGSLSWLECFSWRGAFLYLLLSALGTIGLAISKVWIPHSQALYLASLYWYLHFQYNGWFFSALLALVLPIVLPAGASQRTQTAVKLLLISVAPGYTLSILWLRQPAIAYALPIMAIALQTAAAVPLASQGLKAIHRQAALPLHTRAILYGILTAILAKLLLQLLSVVPAISQFAFGFRPVVIAYLHLVLLCILSSSVLMLLLRSQFAAAAYWPRIWPWLITFIFINQCLLGIQAITSIRYWHFPIINVWLLVVGVAITLLIIILIIQHHKALRQPL
ncbi:MAG: hypothetical protein MUF62_11630 [Chitinophagaceae bacterium]|jgi:hypothetical protein|nr:hypothetical protein [Chitinophagaceae bacterium]